jgi:hypothetical protein
MSEQLKLHMKSHKLNIKMLMAVPVLNHAGTFGSKG